MDRMSPRKAAIVTGSATGVGAATALALARRGYDVLINYSRSEAEAKQSQAACRDAGPIRCCCAAMSPLTRIAGNWRTLRWTAGSASMRW